MRDGLVTLRSPFAPQETFARLLAAVADRGLRVFATVDHAAAAKEVGLEMNAASLLIFGSPKAGTALMQLAPTLAIDLPLKALVWEDDEGSTWLTYNEPGWLAGRHGLVAPHEAEMAWETAGGARDANPDNPGLATAEHLLGTQTAPLLGAMSRVLPEIADAALRTSPAA